MNQIQIDHIELMEQWLFGKPKPKILNEWPTLRDILQVMYFNLLVQKRKRRACGKRHAKSVRKNIFYRISTKYKLYVSLRKSKHRKAAFSNLTPMIKKIASKTTLLVLALVLVMKEPKSSMKIAARNQVVKICRIQQHLLRTIVNNQQL
jgi:hypothetical protein